MPAGRPTEYTQEIVDLAKDYLETYSSKYGHAIPSVVGLCKVVNRARSTLYEWAKDKDNEFSDILACINELQELVSLNGGIKGELNPQIVKLVLGKHGYHDKQDTNVGSQPDNPLVVIGAEMPAAEATALYKTLLDDGL